MATVEERLAALEAKVAALRARDINEPAADGAFWALEALNEQFPEGTGAVVYAGVVRLEQSYRWQYGFTVDDLLGADWAELVGGLTALAHPVRLQLLREILGGRHGTAELAEIEGLGTTGQLYHHLRQLTAAGWLRTSGRGQYAIPPERVVPLLAVLSAVRR